ATFAGASPSVWELSAVRSEDPARLPLHDRTWLAAAREGGALLDRYGIELAILPETLVASSKLHGLASRGSWTLVKLPVAPPASVMRGVMWSEDATNTIDLLFPASGGTGVLRGTVVLAGRGAGQPDRGPPMPCTIERWHPGAIDLVCTSDVAAYAAIASTPSAGCASPSTTQRRRGSPRMSCGAPSRSRRVRTASRGATTRRACGSGSCSPRSRCSG
ncbi:MAG: hypothetical protein ABI175_04340, partial [Polyangiales bacterium]